MNKAELVNAIESKLGGRKAATDALEAVLDQIIREVAKGGKVAITGFGTFQKVAREARTGRNPRTGETVRIKKTTVPRFRPGTSFKNIVADPRKLPKTSPAAARASAGTATKAATPTTKAAPATRKAAATKRATKTATATKAAPAKRTTKTAAKSTTAKTTAAKSAPARSTAAKKTSSAAAKRTAKAATATT